VLLKEQEHFDEMKMVAFSTRLKR